MEILMEGWHGVKGSASTVIGVSGASGPTARCSRPVPSTEAAQGPSVLAPCPHGQG